MADNIIAALAYPYTHRRCIDSPAGANYIVIDGNVITLDCAVKGGQTLSQETFDITATTTLDEFLAGWKVFWVSLLSPTIRGCQTLPGIQLLLPTQV